MRHCLDCGEPKEKDGFRLCRECAAQRREAVPVPQEDAE
jgi:NMD protein affecting ribosome stability and mRNA decay